MAPMTLPPGFRFHPTDEELVAYYLKRKINGRKIELEIIPAVDLYKCEPWDLPEKSFLPSKDLEWYFFSPRDRKYPNGSRTNRATKAGYWKATGKDRKVMSHMREVGMKKTLVYYRGRAPHGSRTDWVMHEYRLDERECETLSGLQDAYALCRVFKKNGLGPKMDDQYVAPYDDHSQWMHNDRSSGMELSSDGRGEDMESNGYPFPSDTCSSGIVQGAFHVHEQGDGAWMQFLAEEALSSTDPPFPDNADFAFLPSKVDVALERARLHQRLTLPPLEMDDFPQIDLPGPHSVFSRPDVNQVDILQEILSVACASQQLIDQSNHKEMWATAKYHPSDELSPVTELEIGGRNEKNQVGDVVSSKLIEISDLEEEFKGAKVVENLRGVKMSHKNLEESTQEHNTVLIESISNFQKKEEPNTDKDYEPNDFSLGFINADGEMDNSPGTPTFDVYEKIEFNRGLFVASHNVAQTFFHHIEPSKTVSVHMDVMVMHGFPGLEPDMGRKCCNRQSTFSKFKAFARDKLVGIKTFVNMANSTVGVLAVLLTSFICLGEVLENLV
ncbi:NAC domain-containing protein 54-like isoform X2 [Magnolia sinica]|uniref:NAC domain-containing protein 54-like isoform X2 n=1 Tax=Magnolia sinica TaxID=86752 RepID=UPI002657AC5F|nr:NAC domain-containing protein 54-like isoform X2 [Magnolia sinica]